MILFPDRERNDLSPARYTEPHIDYLERSSRVSFQRVRELIESWLSEVASYHRTRLVPRLRSRDDHHFEAAFFELYLHALTRRLGFQVGFHPRMSGTRARPDFVLLRAGASPILLEGATVDEFSVAERSAHRRTVAIYDALNAIECPDYFFSVEIDGSPDTPVPLKRLRNHVRDFIGGLKYETIRTLAAERGPLALPGTIFVHDGCRVTISVIPVSPEHRGSQDHRPIGVTGLGEARIVDNYSPLRKAIRTKGGKYGQLRRPLIIAVNAAGRYLHQIHIMNALFGTEAFVFARDREMRNQVPRLVRASDGVWRGPKGVQYTRVSAVLFVSSLAPWSVAVREPVLYLNPWARTPLRDGFDVLERFVPEGGQLVPHAGEPIREILGLPQGWPGDD